MENAMQKLLRLCRREKELLTEIAVLEACYISTGERLSELTRMEKRLAKLRENMQQLAGQLAEQS